MNIFALTGMMLILHSGFWFMKLKKFSKQMGQEVETIPLDVNKNKI